MNAQRGSGRFATIEVYNRCDHKVSATWDGVDEEWAPHETKHLQPDIGWHCVNRTVLSLDPRTNIRECQLAVLHQKDDDGNVIEVRDLTPEDETLLRAGGSLIPLDAMQPPEGFVPGEDGEITAKTLSLPTDVRFARGSHPEITNAPRLEGGKRFIEPRPGWNKDMDQAADMAATAAAQDAAKLS